MPLGQRQCKEPSYTERDSQDHQRPRHLFSSLAPECAPLDHLSYSQEGGAQPSHDEYNKDSQRRSRVTIGGNGNHSQRPPQNTRSIGEPFNVVDKVICQRAQDQTAH